MPWVAKGNEEATLKNSIKLKFKLFADDTPSKTKINDAYKLLLEAANYKQASAVVDALDAIEDVQKVKTFGFQKLTNNAPATIKAAITPAVQQAAVQQNHQVQLTNTHINGYLRSVTGENFRAHRNGTFTKPLPIYEVVGNQNMQIVRTFGNSINGHAKLPVKGHYVEWYAKVGSDRSKHKRFFTSSGDNARLWFTDGGTHGNADDWWEQKTANGPWTKMT